MTNLFIQFYNEGNDRAFVENSNDWGRMERSADTRYDLFQTFVEDSVIVGFQLALAPIRGSRPREQYPKTKTKVMPELSPENVLSRIIRGGDEAVLISTSREFKGDPFSALPVKIEDLSSEEAVSIVNRFSIFSRVDPSNRRGVMLVVVPTEVLQFPRDSPSATSAIIRAITTSVSGTFDIHGPMRLTTFFNIGPKSGSSLIQLHAQVYIFDGLEHRVGSTEYVFFKSYDYQKMHDMCLACQLTERTSANLADGLDDQRSTFLRSDLDLWEDEHMILRLAYAPLRYAHLRIFPKRHIAHIGDLTGEECDSLGYAISLGDYLMKDILGSFWGTIPEDDRSVIFRQRTDSDFHMLVDMLPVYMGLGGAELIIPLSIHSKKPEQFAKLMRKTMEDLPDYLQR